MEVDNNMSEVSLEHYQDAIKRFDDYIERGIGLYN